MINEEIEILSLAGKESGGKYNINKTKTIKKNLSSKDFTYYPDKEYFNSLKGKKQFNPEEILRETDFDINKIKKSIQENNIYYNDEEKNNYTNKINNIKESRNKNMLKTYINNSQENNQLFKGKKYKYYNEHIQRIKRYKEDGIFAKILSQQESLYSPHFDYIFKKIYSGPKWDKLTGREDLFKPVKKKPNININISTEKKIKKRIKKIKERNKNKNIYLKKAKNIFSTKINNNTLFSNINNNKTNFTTNELHSSLENTDKNNILFNNILSIDNNKTFLEKNKILKLKSNKKTLKLKTKKNDIFLNKIDHIPGPDFNRYLDLEK